MALACCGIGEMLLVDFDTVEISNLNRQVLYGEGDVGRPKAKLAAERLRTFNSAMRLKVLEERLDSEAAVAAAIDGYDLVVNAVDWPAHDIEVWVNSACFASGIPYIAMSHYPPIARVGRYMCREKLAAIPARRSATSAPTPSMTWRSISKEPSHRRPRR